MRFKIKEFRVVDGDTVHLTVDLGRVRLLDIDADELPEGEEAKQWLIQKMEQATNLVLDSQMRQGKYRRFLGYILADGENLNESIVDEGLAEKY